MEILRYILIAVEVICCLLLIGVILLQQSKSQGMGLAFGGGMTESLFGSRAGNVLTKFTVILALVFLANTTLLGILYTEEPDVSVVETAALPAAPVAAPVSAPAAPGLMTAPEPVSAPSAEIPMVTEVAPTMVAPVDASSPVVTEPVVEVAPAEPVAAPEEVAPASATP